MHAEHRALRRARHHVHRDAHARAVRASPSRSDGLEPPVRGVHELRALARRRRGAPSPTACRPAPRAAPAGSGTPSGRRAAGGRSCSARCGAASRSGGTSRRPASSGQATAFARVDRLVDGQHVVCRLVGVAVRQEPALVRAGHELHGAHLDRHVVHRQPDAERLVVELGLPVRVVLVPEHGAPAGRLADHVAPARELGLGDAEQRRGVAPRVPPVLGLQELGEADLREERLREQRRLVGARVPERSTGASRRPACSAEKMNSKTSRIHAISSSLVIRSTTRKPFSRNDSTSAALGSDLEACLGQRPDSLWHARTLDERPERINQRVRRMARMLADLAGRIFDRDIQSKPG